jgi:hypothetical protein
LAPFALCTQNFVRGDKAPFSQGLKQKTKEAGANKFRAKQRRGTKQKISKRILMTNKKVYYFEILFEKAVLLTIQIKYLSK